MGATIKELSQAGIDKLVQSLNKNSAVANNEVISSSPKASVATMHTYHIADLSEKYETSGKGPGYISSGSKWGDPGGDSYGSYQIETKKGTMQEYLNYNDRFSSQLKGLKINSAIFVNKWMDLANKFPEDFQQSQFDFLCSKSGGYNDAIKHAKKLGWLSESFALQSAIFSTSNQSGKWKSGIFAKAGIHPSDVLAIQINKLYDARAKYFLELSSLSSAIKKSIMQQRCGKNLNLTNFKGSNERLDCLSLSLKETK